MNAVYVISLSPRIQTEESVEELLEKHGLVSTGDDDMDRHMIAMMMTAQDIMPDTEEKDDYCVSFFTYTENGCSV